ncbi:hypothetical protein CRG98_009905 [Punica granatum]|uniref:Uncharacterized protein n=1 Tax=Punica granatum TaxID=22663 RepID=A0A2I0KMR5_PUNGR|nr:hypothetical protein CRG98_009905 [Punica granatum]
MRGSVDRPMRGGRIRSHDAWDSPIKGNEWLRERDSKLQICLLGKDGPGPAHTWKSDLDSLTNISREACTWSAITYDTESMIHKQLCDVLGHERETRETATGAWK